MFAIVVLIIHIVEIDDDTQFPHNFTSSKWSCAIGVAEVDDRLLVNWCSTFCTDFVVQSLKCNSYYYYYRGTENNVPIFLPFLVG